MISVRSRSGSDYRSTLVTTISIVGMLLLSLLIVNGWSWQNSVMRNYPILEEVHQARVNLDEGYIQYQRALATHNPDQMVEAMTRLRCAEKLLDKALIPDTSRNPYGDRSGLFGKSENQLNRFRICLGYLLKAVDKEKEAIWGGEITTKKQFVDERFEATRAEANACDEIARSFFYQELTRQVRNMRIVVALWLLLGIGTLIYLIVVRKGRLLSSNTEQDAKVNDRKQCMADVIAYIPSSVFIYQYRSPESFILLDCNSEAEATMGIKIEEWRGKDLNEMWSKARELGLFQKLVEVMQGGQAFQSDNFAYKEDRIDSILRIRAFRMPEDKLCIAFENITERTRAYEVLRESEERHRFMYRNSPVMLCSIDPEGWIIGFSKCYLERLGYSKEEVIGKRVTNFFTLESRSLLEKTILSELFGKGNCRNIALQMTKKNGEPLDVLFSGIVEKNQSGQVIQSLVMLIEVDELKKWKPLSPSVNNTVA